MVAIKKNRVKQKVEDVVIKKESKLVWIPRFFSVLLALALFLFVGEIFSESFQWSHFMSAIMPGMGCLLVAHIAWRNSRIGGMLFIIIGIGLVLMDMVQGRNIWGTYVLALVTFSLGWLFLIFRKK